MQKAQISPSLLAADFGNLSSEIQSVSSADYLHIDVMDGSFVPPITFGTNMVEVAKKHSALPLDVHLMINYPEKHIENYSRAGASILTIHQEVSPHLHRTLETIKSFSMKAGVAINPGTPAETVLDVLEIADLVLVMTVNPGWGGQKFIESTLSKIATIKNASITKNPSLLIEVDGGIDEKTALLCRKEGANMLVAGTYIFSSSDRTLAINNLR